MTQGAGMAPASANNAAVGGSMVLLLTLGIPGSAATAVMIGGLTIHCIVPSPVAEISLRRALMLGGMDWSSVVMRPIAGTLLALSLLSLIYGLYGQFRRQYRARRALVEAAV